MELSSPRILITGGSGLIGTNAVNYCIDKGYECVNFDIKPPRCSSHTPHWVSVKSAGRSDISSGSRKISADAHFAFGCDDRNGYP
jgi:nucleoside-diphosphate-sugar epimerase